jgi:hypothetical protein
MGHELSSDHTKCELTHCAKIEEVCLSVWKWIFYC